MKRLSFLKGMLTWTLLTAPGLMSAGNIPQYLFSTGDSKYVPLVGATVISDKESEGYTYIMPEGEDPNDFVSEGFDLGMKFRLGGSEFDRFVVENNGKILLGNGFVNNKTAFTVAFHPMLYGLKKARISYKNEGNAGRRVFTLEYADVECGSEGNSSLYPGFYDMQIKLHEDSGRVEIIFHQPEDSSPTQSNGFCAGITGWDLQDALYIRGKSLREFYDSRFSMTVSPDFTTASAPVPNVLEPSTYLVWDSNDYEEFTVNYNLDPVLSKAAPAGTPRNLKATQTESEILITAERDPSAPATVILYSTEPFTSADYPVDGNTFLAGPKAKFGNATALYYGDEDHISATIEGVQPNTAYYIQALSVTGYPVYGKANPAQVIFRTTQPAPTTFDAQALSPTDLQLSWSASDRVIIAVTTTKMPGYMTGYSGLFGQPSANVQEGDRIPGGGKVIYVGNGRDFTYNGDPNTLYFFRAWTLRNNSVSSTWHDAVGVGTPVLPYEPDVINYPIAEPLIGWDASRDQFTPTVMDFSELEALRATSSGDALVSLTTPLIPINESSRISFEFSLETEMGGAGGLNLGCQPGYFGTGALRVLVNGQEEYCITEYNGSMRGTGQSGTYETGSSTMQPESFTISAVGDARITFQFSASTSSTLYLRNIKVVGQSSVGVVNSEVGISDKPTNVYNIAGVRMNVDALSELAPGLYIVDGRKVMIK